MSDGSPLWLVLPTYDEAENLEAMVAAVGEELPVEHRILVVDDDSPDGTGRIADRLASERDDLEVLHRSTKEGIGPAYIAGFRHALDRGAALVIQMDADFSHEPSYLPAMLKAIDGVDVVIGSRYVPGGGVSDWGPLRRLISRCGSVYARTILGVSIQDLTGGFKVFRREVLEAIELTSIPSQGYAFQIETTYRALKTGFRVVEIPIVFRDRRVGESKMSGGIVFEAARRVPVMRRYRR
ncbi:N/A [soil metagenome]